MSAIIEDQIRRSLGDINYDRAVEGIGTMREELIAYEEPGLYNGFIQSLKEKLLEDRLGGDRREMWWLIRKNRLGLIDKKALDISDVTEEQAREVRCPIYSSSVQFGANCAHSFCPQGPLPLVNQGDDCNCLALIFLCHSQ